MEHEVVNKKYKDNPHLEGTRDEFLEKNFKLVYYVAKRFSGVLKLRTDLDFQDLVGYGSMGLLKAYERFNPDLVGGVVKFSTYAVPLIQGEIFRYIRDTYSSGIKVSRTSRELGYKLMREVEDLQELETYTTEKIMEQFEVNETIAKEALEFAAGKTRADSLDRPIQEDEKSKTTFVEKIAGKEENYEERILLNQFVDTLSERERRIYKLSFEDQLQQEVVGRTVGISQVQVSRILKRILKKAEEFIKTTKQEEEESNMASKEFEKVMKLLKTTDKTVSEIAKETGVSLATVDYYAREIRDGVSPVAVKKEEKEKPKLKPVLPPVKIKDEKEEKKKEKPKVEKKEKEEKKTIVTMPVSKAKTVVNLTKEGEELSVETIRAEFEQAISFLESTKGKASLKLELKVFV